MSIRPAARPRRAIVTGRLILLAACGAGAGSWILQACEPSADDKPPLHRNQFVSATGGGAGSGGDGGGGGVLIGGPIQDPSAPCDAMLAVDEADPLAAARAVDICKKAVDGDWGIVSAKWTMPDGSDIPVEVTTYDIGHGIVDGFGTLPVRSGARMLALSSGAARRPTDPDYSSPAGLDKGYTSTSPKGYPKNSQACPGVMTGDPHDGVALEVTMKAPDEAVGFTFDFDFHTYEWPAYICSTFNDYFLALLDPAPAGQPDGNVSFDSKGNSVSVNNAFLRVCGCAPKPPCMAGGKSFSCALGDDSLVGTGFEGAAATGWLVTTAPVEPGTIVTLRWAVYDSGDGVLDSTTLIDSFHWLAGVDAGVQTLPDDAETPK